MMAIGTMDIWREKEISVGQTKVVIQGNIYRIRDKDLVSIKMLKEKSMKVSGTKIKSRMIKEFKNGLITINMPSGKDLSLKALNRVMEFTQQQTAGKQK